MATRIAVPGKVAPPTAALVALLMTLTVVTGLIDAVSVLGLGRVFTANMTGNVVFLGFALAGVPDFSAARSLVSLAAFLVGATVGGRLGVRYQGTRSAWLLRTAILESILFLAAAVVAQRLTDSSRSDVGLYVIIVLTAVAMGIRNATVRRLAVPDLTTTVLTLTLTGLGADSSLAGGNAPRWQRRITSVIAMLGGALLGALLVQRTGLVVPLMVTAVVPLGATLLWRNRLEAANG